MAPLKHQLSILTLYCRWKSFKYIFLINFLIYCAFLLVYSLYLGNIFYRAKTHKVTLREVLGSSDSKIFFPTSELALKVDLDQKIEIKDEGPGPLKKNVSRWIIRPAFDSCSRKKRMGTCTLEICLTLTVALLLIQEIVQLMAIGIRHYGQELENYIELTVIGLAMTGLATQNHENLVKWLSAFGIVFGYLELVFLLGR